MTPDPIISYLEGTLQFARNLSDSAGRMRDPYETEYGENFSPACFSVVAAAMHRLHGRPEDRDWALRWGRRSAAIMRESSGLREYVLGYAAMVFGLLGPDTELESLRQEYAAASRPEEALSPFAHILALQLIGDLLCPRSAASGKRAETIVDTLERLWTPAGFPEDQHDGDDGSIPHAYLTVASLVIFLIARPQTEPARRLQPRIESLIARACAWFERANGPAMVAAQANRSYNQLWVFPLYALLAYVHRGAQAAPAVARCLEIVTRATDSMRRPNFLPTDLSPYASAGNEPYNRVNNDVGAGGVGLALLAVLQAAGLKGFGAHDPAPAQVMIDATAGYACFHGAAGGLLMPTKRHRWRYHYPLQPAWVVVGAGEAPFVGAKRSGVNHPYAALLADPARVNPLLELYFGVMVAEPGGIHHVMQEPVEARPGNVFCATLRPEGAEPSTSPARVSVEVGTEANALELTYRIEGEVSGEWWLSIPVLLWDGSHELRYTIESSRVALDWRARSYALTATVPAGGGDRPGLPGAWRLRRERFFHTGFGVTGNFALALGPVRAVRVRLEAR